MKHWVDNMCLNGIDIIHILFCIESACVMRFLLGKIIKSNKNIIFQ